MEMHIIWCFNIENVYSLEYSESIFYICWKIKQFPFRIQIFPIYTFNITFSFSFVSSIQLAYLNFSQYLTEKEHMKIGFLWYSNGKTLQNAFKGIANNFAYIPIKIIYYLSRHSLFFKCNKPSYLFCILVYLFV